MDAKTGFFYFFSAVLLYSALRVITSRNPDDIPAFNEAISQALLAA